MLILALTLMLHRTIEAEPITQEPGTYAHVNGLKLYYENHGTPTSKSTPLVLIHGGMGGIEMFGPNLAVLAKDRRVIAVNLQGHGHTPDIDRPLKCELMADDMAALLKDLKIPQADFMGYSLGAAVALQVAIKHPEVVRKLVVVSTAFKKSGWYPEVQKNFDMMTPAAGEVLKQSPLAKLYPDVDFGKLFGKLGDLLRQDYDWSSDVAKIKTPTMIVFADADAIQPSHMIEFYSLLGGGKKDPGMTGSGRSTARLAIVPGTTHYDILATTTVAELAKPFLDAKAGK